MKRGLRLAGTQSVPHARLLALQAMTKLILAWDATTRTLTQRQEGVQLSVESEAMVLQLTEQCLKL